MISMWVHFSDDQIKGIIQKAIPICSENKCGFCLTISGYDDDPRDLWNIPEVVSFMKRLVDIGFISILEVSTNSKELMRTEYKDIDKLPGFGAIEVWMMANKKIAEVNSDNSVTTEITEDEIFEFFSTINESNEKSRIICSEKPYKNEKPIESLITCSTKNGSIPDGQNKHASY